MDWYQKHSHAHRKALELLDTAAPWRTRNVKLVAWATGKTGRGNASRLTTHGGMSNSSKGRPNLHDFERQFFAHPLNRSTKELQQLTVKWLWGADGEHARRRECGVGVVPAPPRVA